MQGSHVDDPVLDDRVWGISAPVPQVNTNRAHAAVERGQPGPDPMARPSVSPLYPSVEASAAPIAIRTGFTFVAFGIRTASTPPSNSATMCAGSTSLGSSSLRLQLPHGRSCRISLP